MESMKEYWNIDTDAGILLQALLFTHQPKNILEIGTSNGYSAILMAEVASQYGGHITTIEFSEKRIALAQTNIEDANLSEYITILQGDAAEVLSKLSASSPDLSSRAVTRDPDNATWIPGQARNDGMNHHAQHFDLFFIDASKKDYLDFFNLCMKIASPHALLVFDNTISHKHALAEFHEAMQHNKKIQILELDIGDGLLIAKLL